MTDNQLALTILGIIGITATVGGLVLEWGGADPPTFTEFVLGAVVGSVGTFLTRRVVDTPPVPDPPPDPQ